VAGGNSPRGDDVVGLRQALEHSGIAEGEKRTVGPRVPHEHHQQEDQQVGQEAGGATQEELARGLAAGDRPAQGGGDDAAADHEEDVDAEIAAAADWRTEMVEEHREHCEATESVEGVPVSRGKAHRSRTRIR
jgi:hypothetical protein